MNSEQLINIQFREPEIIMTVFLETWEQYGIEQIVIVILPLLHVVGHAEKKSFGRLIPKIHDDQIHLTDYVFFETIKYDGSGKWEVKNSFTCVILKVDMVT